MTERSEQGERGARWDRPGAPSRLAASATDPVIAAGNGAGGGGGTCLVAAAHEAAAAPRAVTGQYLPSLDGLRALAVGGVLAYHLEFGWASGGYLGVDLFFVLSGFLITSLLLEEWVATAKIRLTAFWARRARRLLPALFLLLVAIGLYVVLTGRFGSPGAIARIDLSGLRGDAIATLLYVANWHAIFAHQSYFAHYAAPSPLEQTWSLAIEEQFYLVWPPALLLFLAWCARRPAARDWRRIGVVITVVGGLASAVLMVVLFHPGTDPSRVYFGTDTRSFDLLAGATVAMVVAARPQPGRRWRITLHVVAVGAAIGLGAVWVTGGTARGVPTNWMFDGGFLLCAVMAALVVADVRQVQSGPLGAVLAVRPLRWVGRISYGIYLWHWPVFVYLTASRTGLSSAWLDVARVGSTVLLATASYYLVERPIRRRRFTGWRRMGLAPAGAVVTAAVVVVATIPAVVVPPAPTPVVGAVATHGDRRVPGAGGYQGQVPIALPPFGPSHPLRVTVVGDSVANVSEPAIAAALGATGEVKVTNAAIDGFGLNTDPTWRTSIPRVLASDRTQLVVATWSWDDSCTPRTPTPVATYHTYICALQHPHAYTAMIEEAVRLMLGPGGASGVAFMEFPPTGPVLSPTPAGAKASDRQRAAGEKAWNRIVRSLPAVFPGQVMYLPVASSVLLHGRFTPWLPPANDPTAPPRKWERVRMVDDVHLCPAGAARYANALLADLTTLLHLRSAATGWVSRSWTQSPVYNTPPGSCPDDHPPG